MVGGEDCLGGGGSNDSQVNSLVDLVKLLHSSDNPLWDLVRFEVRESVYILGTGFRTTSYVGQKEPHRERCMIWVVSLT